MPLSNVTLLNFVFVVIHLHHFVISFPFSSYCHADLPLFILLGFFLTLKFYPLGGEHTHTQIFTHTHICRGTPRICVEEVLVFLTACLNFICCYIFLTQGYLFMISTGLYLAASGRLIIHSYLFTISTGQYQVASARLIIHSDRTSYLRHCLPQKLN